MLSIGKIAAGPRAARYYTEQVARGREDYYSGEGEAPGQWVGSGAAALGWIGEVEDDRFAALLDGAGLRKAPREGAVAGFDLTFRAPKSVSVLWAVVPPHVTRELRAAHDEAVTQALGYVEREACRARRGRGGVLQVNGAGFVGAAFVHRASRAGDPLLHTHIVVGNLTQGPDGRWTALDGRHLYRHAKTAGYLYQAVLRRELTERLGVEWHPVERGVADLVGVPRAVIEHFSQRRAQILEHMAEHGGRSAASAQVAALDTRRAKQDVPIDRRRADWRARAVEQGLDDQVVARVFGRTRQLELPTPSVLRALTEHQSTFGRPEILQALAQAHPYGATVVDLERQADAVLADREVVRLQDGRAQAAVNEARFSTREMLATEKALIDGAAARGHQRAGRANFRAITEVLDEYPTLSDEQRQVVRELCDGHGGVVLVRAAAGTGKTFALDAAREAWQRSHIDVIGCALSARAALELADQAGIESVTIAALRDRLERGDQLPEGGVLVVDEAGMVGTRALADLADAAARAHSRLVLVGDDRQLPEIEAGGAFRALADRLGASELHEVRRQRDGWDRQALDELRSGDVERWARAYRDAGRITVARRPDEARAALVNDYVRADGDKLMIAARRSDVRDLNDLAREVLRSRDELGPDGVSFGGRAFAVGDRVVGTRNDRRLGILNGQRGQVGEIDGEHETVTVRLDDGKEVTVDSDYLRAGHLDHGYAMTAHRAQGATVDRSFVLGSEELYREWGYTALSRHRDEARFYISRGDLGLPRDQTPDPDTLIYRLQALLEHSHAKDLAHDNLSDLDAQTLAREHARLRERIGWEPPPHPNSPRRVEEASHARLHLDQTREREAKLRQERERTPWYRRKERQGLDRILSQHQNAVDYHEERWQQAHDRYAYNAAAERAWIDQHGRDAHRYLAVDHEHRHRLTHEIDARQRLEALHRGSDPLDPPGHGLHRDIGRDIDGWDMGP